MLGNMTGVNGHFHPLPQRTGAIAMADLKSQFEQAVKDSKALPEKPDNMTLLKIYALYKQASAGDVGQWLDDSVRQPVAAIVFRRRLPLAGRRVHAAVGDRQHHRDQCDAVADAVVHAGDQCAATFVAVDQVELPERVRRVERRVRQFADERLQRLALALAAFAVELLMQHVALQVEAVVADPARTHRVPHDLLAEALVLEQLVFDALAQRRVRDAGLQQPDADDHHQVHVVVHPQPGGVHARHALRAGWHRGFSVKGCATAPQDAG